MSDGKRYYWLKLKDDFFTSKRIKKLRKLAGGDTYTIIYLKLQLLSIKTEGILTYTGLENSVAEELALDIDENIEDVRVTLAYLQGCGLIETSDNTNFFLPYAIENTGSETASTQRVREFRARQKALQRNADETEVKRIGNAEKEIEKEIEIDKEKDINKPAPKPDIFSQFAVGDDELLSALKDFEKMRTKIKKPMTERAKSLLLGKLQSFPREQWIAILEQSIMHDWQNLYALKEERSSESGAKREYKKTEDSL